MYCRVCGDESTVKYHRPSGLFLCPDCAADTPRKASREAFDRAYWPTDEIVPESTKREFYDDYQVSTHTLKEYIKATTFDVS